MLDLVIRHLAWTSADGPDADIALTTRVRLARNLEGFPFPSHADDENLKKVMEEITSAIARVDSERSLEIYPLKSTSRLERQVLAERHLASGDHLADIENRTLVLSRSGTISLMINEEDHLRTQCILSGLSPEPAWETLDRLDSLLSEQVNFAYLEKYGFLTSYPTNIGTGLRVSVMVHLPALAIHGRLLEVLKAAATLGTTVRGVYGEGSATAGNLYQISNSVTIGLSEEDIIHRVVATAHHLIREERETRELFLRKKPLEIEDRVYRAFGLLTFCRKISTVEATTLLSDLRLGTDLRILPQPDSCVLNELLLSVRPGWLQLTAGHPMNAEERDIRRAEFLREKLSDILH